MLRNRFLIFTAVIFIMAGVLALTACEGTGNDDVTSRSYSGHESDADANNFVRAYKGTVGTRLDDCHTCHVGKTVTTVETPTSRSKDVDYSNPCSYCHLRVFDAAANYSAGYPATLRDTLNDYGKAYMDAGRDVNAIKAIDGQDSDLDGYANGVEIAALRFPGSASSKPGQDIAPSIELTWNEITALPKHTQFMLLNANKQQYDEYTTYAGARMIDLMNYLNTKYNVDFTNATDMVFYSPDGYKVELNIATRITNTYDKGIFYDLTDEQATWRTNGETNRPFVSYPLYTYGLEQGNAMPHDMYAIMAYQREELQGSFVNLDTSYYDSVSGRIGGEGPYRIVRPQVTRSGQTAPDGPDRSTNTIYNQWDDGWRYADAYDHNAGDAAKGTCIIKILPMPAGVEEYYTANGWSLIDDRKIVVYGCGVPAPTR